MDVGRFDRLFQAHAKNMVSLAKRLLGGDEALAEDLVQSVFLLLLSRPGAIDGYQHPEAWLYVALRNQIKNELRRACRSELPLEAAGEAAAAGDPPPPLAESLPPGLTAREREILISYYEDRIPHEVLAPALGCSVPACRTRLFRAREHCRRLLEEGAEKKQKKETEPVTKQDRQHTVLMKGGERDV